MKLGKACAIFAQINTDKYTEQDKLQAINQVLEMPTHNGITKDEILTAFRWLFNQVTVEENEKQTNADRIRAMSDEELSEFLREYFTCEYECAAARVGCSCDCSGAVMHWLQSEVEE